MPFVQSITLKDYSLQTDQANIRHRCNDENVENITKKYIFQNIVQTVN